MTYDTSYDDLELDACVADVSNPPVHFYQYHIVYLPSYSVPVLLLQAHHEGQRNSCMAFMTSQLSSHLLRLTS